MDCEINGDSDMRKLPLALACALVFGTSSAFAMGLGELQTQSNLNQPLRAVIPIKDVRPNDLDALRVKIGDEAQFARHGYSLMSVYGRIKLQVVGGQRPHILLTTDTPVRDPVLGLVLEIDGPSGTLERAVSILLDPEGYAPMAVAKPATVRNPVSDTQPRDQIYATEKRPTQRSAAPAQELPPIKDGGEYTAVSGDTAYGIAQRVKPEGVSLQQTIGMILQSNPQAFANPADASTLLAGKTLTIPNAQAMRQARPVVAVAQPKPADSAPAAQIPAAGAATEPRLDIVQPTSAVTPSVPVVVAPVVGEVVSGAAGTSTDAPAANVQGVVPSASIPAEVQEQIEASKVENERLTGLLASQDQRLQKMEELLRLNESLIKDMEQKLNTAPAVPTVPVAAPVEAATPWWSFALMGLGALLAAALAFVAGSRRRSTNETDAAVAQPVTSVELEKRPEQTESVVVAPAVVAPAVAAVAASQGAAADVIEDAADPIKAALEEADVMQAYGLHDRAIQVLSDALQDQPGNAVLMARYARAMHEAGDADGFLREAQAFREEHPNDEAQWAELRALGAAHYSNSPLFTASAASALASEKSPWVQPAAEVDEASALIQPLDSLGLATPDAALDELLGSQAATQSSSQPSATSFDMPPLELDLPVVSSFQKTSESKSSAGGDVASDTATTGKVDDLLDDWAPLELPVAAGSVQAASQDEISVESVVSEDDLAVLGIDLHEAEANLLASVASAVPAVEPALTEADFVEDMQVSSPPQTETAALDLDFVPLPLTDAAPQRVAPDEPLTLDLAAFEPLDLAAVSPLSLEVVTPEAVSLELVAAAPAAPEVVPLELPLTSAFVENLQEASSAPMPTSGMMSEQEVKLDIAAAYMDMGDHAGAREMLEEVMASDCDELLKSRAAQMMARLSA